MIYTLTSNNNQCKLLDNVFSYLIQFFLGAVSIGSLIFKRHIEIPKRSWKIWLFDVSKQLIGGFFTHIANIMVSEYILYTKGGDECAWYFINFVVDCTIGIFFVYIFHYGLCYFFKINKIIGYYGNPPETRKWFNQMVIYVASLFLNKIVIVTSLYFLKEQFTYLGNEIFKNIQNKPNLELLIVMIICPFILTTIQMWIFDFMLKNRKKKKFSLLHFETDDTFDTITV